MLTPPKNEWTEAYIQSLIENQVEENLNLDYKACDALGKTERKKNEISKDISAFANSDGGIIIYGVVEGKDDTKHLPVSIDSGFDPAQISKEWLEQVINSRIQRRISGIKIYPVELVQSNPGKYIYVVEIPQSKQAPHQAADKRYYKRFNFESVPMEDYEIRDITHRPVGPDLWMVCSPGESAYLQDDNVFTLMLGIKNKSVYPAETALVTVWIDKKLQFKQQEPEGGQGDYFRLPTGEKIEANKYTVYYLPKIPIFGNHVYGVLKDLEEPGSRELCLAIHPKFKTQADNLKVYIKWRIEAPGMWPRHGIFRVSTDADAQSSRIQVATKKIFSEIYPENE